MYDLVSPENCKTIINKYGMSPTANQNIKFFIISPSEIFELAATKSGLGSDSILISVLSRKITGRARTIKLIITIVWGVKRNSNADQYVRRCSTLSNNRTSVLPNTRVIFSPTVVVSALEDIILSGSDALSRGRMLRSKSVRMYSWIGHSELWFISSSNSRSDNWSRFLVNIKPNLH
jgi:hypothetical protein